MGGVFLFRYMIAGFCAGTVTGLFGAGGGMVLVPLLTLLGAVEERNVFPTSVSIILPICAAAIFLTGALSDLNWMTALPYLLGSLIGGFCAGKWGQKIPVKWLHRGLGLLILWGGVQYLW